MSASKMRAAATGGDFDSFSQGVPSGFADGKKLYRDVRKYMGVREERDMGNMTDFETLRDAYLTGKVWNVGDIVEANGLSGEVVRKGTNYLSFMTEDGKVHKAWLHEIELNERNSLSSSSAILSRALVRYVTLPLVVPILVINKTVFLEVLFIWILNLSIRYLFLKVSPSTPVRPT